MFLLIPASILMAFPFAVTARVFLSMLVAVVGKSFVTQPEVRPPSSKGMYESGLNKGVSFRVIEQE